MSEPTGVSPRPDPTRNLLLGLFALQNGLISQADLLAAFRAWLADLGRSLGEVLESEGALRPEHRAIIEPLVEAHLARHGGDPARSLRAFRDQVGGSTARTITQIRMSQSNPEVEASLAALDTDAGDENTLEVEPPGGDASSPWVPHPGGSSAGRFRILRPHARGGLGQVYVARDEELGRQVALKEIQEDKASNPSHRARFLLEAEINGNLEHPGIVPVYGLGAHADGRPFYAMRFIQGDSLREAIERFHASSGFDPVAFRKLLGRFVDVCEAIAYAHSRGVLHRDLKPANVMLGKHGETLIIDWGLAKAIGQPEPGGAGAGDATITPTSGGSHEPTAEGSALGTPQYMSPEQAAGRIDQLGPASDVYGLGAILYAVLVGKAPVPDGTIPVILDKVRRGEISPPSQVRPRVPRALDAVCMKALAHRPEDRYETATALAEDVERWLADEPATAYREPMADRIRRWARRHRAWVLSGAVGLVVLVGVLGASTVLLGRANERTRDQERIARQNLRESSRVVAGMLGKVVAKLPDLKSMDATQKEILEDALEFYTRFVLERGDEPELRLDVARAAARLGDIHLRLDHTGEAEESYEKAIGLLDGLVAAAPESPGPRRLLAASLGSLGRLYESTNRPGPAGEALRRGIDLMEQVEKAGRLDDDGRDALARAAFRLALMHDHFNRPSEARPLYERAAALQEDLISRNPDDPDYRAGLGKTLYELGFLIDRTGRTDLAVPMYERATGLQRGVIRDRPASSADKSDLCGTLSYLGAMYSRSGRVDEAEKAMSEAVSIQNVLVEEHPGVPGYEVNLAKALGNLANHYSRADRADQAERTHLRALKLFESLDARFPEVIDYPHSVALTRLNVALDREGQADPEGALEWLDRTDEALAKLRGKAPTFARGLEAEGISAGYRAQILDRLGRRDEALASLDRAEALIPEGSERESFKSRRALILAHQGKFDEALALAPDSPTPISQVAYGRALAWSVASGGAADPAEADRRGKQAVAFLARAQALGFFKLPSNRELLRTEPDLEPIRSRDDFPALEP